MSEKMTEICPFCNGDVQGKSKCKCGAHKSRRIWNHGSRQLMNSLFNVAFFATFGLIFGTVCHAPALKLIGILVSADFAWFYAKEYLPLFRERVWIMDELNQYSKQVFVKSE